MLVRVYIVLSERACHVQSRTAYHTLYIVASALATRRSPGTVSDTDLHYSVLHKRLGSIFPSMLATTASQRSRSYGFKRARADDDGTM